MRCVGLVGGLGIGAACHYYKLLGQLYPPEQGILELCLVHAHLPTVLEHVSANELQGLADYLLEIIERLKSAGATLIVIPAVTPHFCIAKLKKSSPLPIVDLLEITVDEVRSRQLERVAVFGTRYVMESNLFGVLDRHVEIVSLTSVELDLVHGLYLRLAHNGRAETADVLELNALAKSICASSDVDAILLAGTDFSMVATSELVFPHLDCTGTHLHAITRELRSRA